MSIHRKVLKTGVSYQVQWRDNDGTQRAKRFRTRKDAEAFESQLKINKYQGLLPTREGHRVTLAEYAARWVETKSKHRKRTAERRDGILRLHIIPALGKRTLASITPADINDLVIKWQKAGYRAQTIRNHMNVLNPMLEMALKEELIARNPAQGVELPKLELPKRHPLSGDQAAELIREIPDHYRPFVLFALFTGLRFSELVSLTIEDIHLVNQRVRVSESKTHAGLRDIFLSDSETLFLEQYLSNSRRGAETHALLFVTERGAPINHSNFLKRVFNPAARRAGLDSVRPHDLRRTSATTLAEIGIPPAIVHAWMGHSSYSTTQKYYVSPTASGQAKTAGLISDFLNLNLQHDEEQP